MEQHEPDEVTKEHHYLAQIAAEVRRGWVKKPSSVKQSDFILKFQGRKKSSRKKNTRTEPETSKTIWLAFAGITQPKKST